ncbi:MAG: hypothetical protein V7742_21220 [Halioglobus sp.]
MRGPSEIPKEMLEIFDSLGPGEPGSVMEQAIRHRVSHFKCRGGGFTSEAIRAASHFTLLQEFLIENEMETMRHTLELLFELSQKGETVGAQDIDRVIRYLIWRGSAMLKLYRRMRESAPESAVKLNLGDAIDS